MKVAVIIPTVCGREDYLKRCLHGYLERHGSEHHIVPVVLSERWSGGMAWQEGAEEAVRMKADFLHLTNDDIVPGYNYLTSMIAAVEKEMTPVVLIVTPTPAVLSPYDNMPLNGNPTTDHSSHFEGVPTIQPSGTLGTNASEYPSLPFCSLGQWERIGPMIPSHYGTDKWFGERAGNAGIPRTCVDATFYHYVAMPGRNLKVDGWLGTDRLTFDHNIAYPMYRDGSLPLDSLHPEAKSIAGREMAREWYRQNVHTGELYWETANA